MNPLPRFALFVAAGLAWAGEASAQINIPLATFSLAYPSIDAITLSLDGSLRNSRPTPFIINGSDLALNGTWFCLDPLQTIYYDGSGEPAGNNLVFASTNPANFDLWGAPAPGLTAARIQNLADLFQTYAPSATTSLLAGALQLAVWEIANESSSYPYSLSGDGYLGVTPYNGSAVAANMISIANAMLGNLSSVGVKNTGSPATVQLLIDGSYQRNGTTTVVLVQDLVGFAPVMPIPEPATFALGGVALLLIAIVRHRSRKKAAAPWTPA